MVAWWAFWLGRNPFSPISGAPRRPSFTIKPSMDDTCKHMKVMARGLSPTYHGKTHSDHLRPASLSSHAKPDYHPCLSLQRHVDLTSTTAPRPSRHHSSRHPSRCCPARRHRYLPYHRYFLPRRRQRQKKQQQQRKRKRNQQHRKQKKE